MVPFREAKGLFSPLGFDSQNRNPDQHVSALLDNCPAVGGPAGTCQLPQSLPVKVVPGCRRVSHLSYVVIGPQESAPRC